MNHKSTVSGQVVHVHVGKCGGSTLNSCLNEAGIVFTELHGPKAGAQLEALVSWGASELVFLITLRDPISRFISAFRHDRKRTLDNSDRSIGRLQRRIWEAVFNAFDNPNSLAEGLCSSEAGKRRLATWALSHASHMHIGLGLSSYILPNLVQKLPLERTFCLYQESLQSDIFEVFEALGYSVPSEIPHLNSSRSWTDEPVGDPAVKSQIFSPMGIANLKETLRDDFFLMEVMGHRFGCQPNDTLRSQK